MDYLVILDIIGTIAFALSGFIVAAKHKFDILGIIVISYVTAFGGGVIRDLLVDRPPFIFSTSYPIITVFLTIVIALLLNFHQKEKLTESFIFKFSDSIGLSLFAYTGATIGIMYNFNFGGVVFLAFLTATGGGIIRDIIMNDVPFVLTNDFYGTVSIIIGVILFTLHYFGLDNQIMIYVVLVFGLILRLLAIKYKWKLKRLYK